MEEKYLNQCIQEEIGKLNKKGKIWLLSFLEEIEKNNYNKYIEKDVCANKIDS